MKIIVQSIYENMTLEMAKNYVAILVENGMSIRDGNEFLLCAEVKRISKDPDSEAKVTTTWRLET